MEVLDIIKQLCKERNISIAQLEQALDYGNGSIAKSKGNMSADRMFKIAQYFNVSMEYLMTGKTIQEADDEIAIIRQQQSILLEISKVNEKMSAAYKTLDQCKDEIAKLKSDYNKLELKKRSSTPFEDNEDNNSWGEGTGQSSIFDVFGDEELPFN